MDNRRKLTFDHFVVVWAKKVSSAVLGESFCTKNLKQIVDADRNPKGVENMISQTILWQEKQDGPILLTWDQLLQKRESKPRLTHIQSVHKVFLQFDLVT